MQGRLSKLVWPQWADVLALSGDAADNVPGVQALHDCSGSSVQMYPIHQIVIAGVKGVGLKSAVALLQHYRDIETVLLSASKVRT